ncbi:MAG: acyltransferase family protein [Candidatus Krumholzibacteriia bacterium]
MKEIRSLTTLRALAAFLVFMYHYAWLFPPQTRGAAAGWPTPLMPLWRSGQVGVSIFFVLSGFLITRLYYDRFAAGRGTLRLYFVKRVARIWPLFLCFAAIQHAVLWLRGTPPNAAWLVTGTLTQGFFRDLRYAGLPTAWSLTIEENFYAVAPAIYIALAALALGRGPARRPWNAALTARFVGVLAGAAAVLFGTAAAALLLARALGWTFGGFMADLPHLLHATLGGRFPEFALGIACAFVHRQGRLATVLRGGRATALALASAAGIVGCLVWKDAAIAAGATWPNYAGSYAVALLTGLLILALTREESRASRALAGGWEVYLGRISYGFYLIQLTVLMEPLLALTDPLGPWRLPALCLLMNLVCAACYELIEKPARRGLVARFGGRPAGAAAAA